MKITIKRIVLLSIPLLIAASAFAANDSTKAMNDMATKAVSLFEGPLLKVAINASGFASIVYSIIGGFKPGPFIGGILLLIIG